MPFRGFINNELEAHLTLLQLFMLSKEDKDIANGIACWILLQKKNQQWDNPVTTLNVTSVIWNYYNTITHSNYSVKFSKLKQANVEIENSSNSPLFIDFIYTYNLPLTKVEKKGNGFKIERELYRETNNGYEELTNKTALNIGDKIIAKYIINNSENRNFIRLKSLRNGAFMPANDVSGYKIGRASCRERVYVLV